MPKVSVIIPTYNRANLLPRAIKSVLNQTYKDFELIIVDDGSTDNTKKVVEEFQKKDPRIKYIWQKNSGGEARPRNMGIRHSKGEYIAFLDSDDEWLPEKLEKQVKLLNGDKKTGLVYTNAKILRNSKYSEKTIFELINPKRGIIYKDLFLNRDRHFIPTLTVIVRKNIFEKVGYFDEKLKFAPDYDLWLRIAKHTYVDYIDEVLAIYYIHDSNISKNREGMQRCLIQVKEKFLNENLELKISINKRDLKGWYQVYYSLIRELIKKRRYSEARSQIKTFIKENGVSIKICICWLISHLSNFIINKLIMFFEFLSKRLI